MLILAFCTHVCITIRYDSGLFAFVKILFVKIQLYPEKTKKTLSVRKLKKLRKKLLKKEKKQAVKKKEKKREKSKEKKKSFSDIVSLVREMSSLVISILERLFKYLKIRIRHLEINVATDDAAKTALAYTAVSQSLNCMLYALDKYSRGKCDFENVICRCDYLSEKFSADIDIEFKIRIWQILSILLSSIFSLLKKNMQIGGIANGK